MRIYVSIKVIEFESYVVDEISANPNDIQSNIILWKIEQLLGLHKVVSDNLKG